MRRPSLLDFPLSYQKLCVRRGRDRESPNFSFVYYNLFGLLVGPSLVSSGNPYVKCKTTVEGLR